MSYTEQRKRLRAVFGGTKCLSPASVYDALSARVAESVGYEIGVLSGSVSASILLGAPDLALQTLTEFADQVRRIMRASSLSLVLDADTRALGGNYVAALMRLAYMQAGSQHPREALATLRFLDQHVPPARLGIDPAQIEPFRARLQAWIGQEESTR